MNELLNHAVMNLFIGFGFALINVIVCYFVPRIPRVLSLTYWGLKPRVLILAYLIALIFQLATSPLFRSYMNSAYLELAWSPYQALFNVLGVLVMDLIVMAWVGMRRGAEIGRRQLDVVKNAAADGLEDVGARLAITPEGREEQAARTQAQTEADAKATAERKQRIDDRLKDY
ncbi:MAG: hypothetical protein ABIV47_17340 [Roseiflexaceae bacterium]